MTAQVLKQLWAVFVLLIPSITAAIVAWLTRARFVIVGLRHSHGRGNRYRFNLHYYDELPFPSTVEVLVRVVGAGRIVEEPRPRLLSGPGNDERGAAEKAPYMDGKRCVFTVGGARPKTTWVLQFDTDGRESNAGVEILRPHHPPVYAVASTAPRKPGLDRFLPSRLLLGTLAVCAAFYVSTLNLPGLERFNVLENIAGPVVIGQQEDSWFAQVASAVAGLVGILLAYEFCVRRGKVPVSHGYLGWHPGVPEQKEGGDTR